MFNLNNVNTVYIACGTTDLRKVIDGLVLIVETELKLDPFEKALLVFCNRAINWLFSTSSKGAKSSVMIYSIIEKSIAKKLIVEKYLTYLFDILSKSDVQSKKQLYELMPWLADLPEDVKISKVENN